MVILIISTQLSRNRLKKNISTFSIFLNPKHKHIETNSTLIERKNQSLIPIQTFRPLLVTERASEILLQQTLLLFHKGFNILKSLFYFVTSIKICPFLILSTHPSLHLSLPPSPSPSIPSFLL